MPDSEQLGEEMAPLGIEMVAEAMKSHPEDRRREAEEVFAWCTNNIVPGQFHDPVQVTMQIMQEAMAREVSAAALLNHLDFLNLRDCLNPAGVRQWAASTTFNIFPKWDGKWDGKDAEFQMFCNEVGVIFEKMYAKNPSLNFPIDDTLGDAISITGQRWKHSSVPPPDTKKK